MLSPKTALCASAICAFVLTAPATAQQGRDQIRIVGSSTVYPFTTAVAEQFGRGGKFKTPIVESTGTGGGIKLFCGGVGVQMPDITNASRQMRKGEFEDCQKNGVKDVTEVKIGFDGIVIASSKQAKPSDFTKEQIFLALAKTVPQGGKLVANPYSNWSQIDPKLPNHKIEVLGPPPTSGTRDAFVELVMEEACKTFPEIEAIKSNKQAHDAACKSMREDGVFVEAGENDNLMVQRLGTNPELHAIFGFSFLDQNSDRIQGSKVGGVEPTFENIAAGSYGVSRSLFVYVKNAHVGVVAGIKEFVAEYTSDKALGQDGYLAAKGLIPLPDAERKKVREQALALKPFTL